MPSMKNASPISKDSPSALKAFFLASRPKTWIASISPVLIGTSMAPHVDPMIFFLTFLFSLSIQIGTNFANDYFDFVKGADSLLRNGPKRATMEGWIQPKTMLKATLLIFSFSIIVAIPLMIQAGLWSFFLALLCVLSGILYTGGPKPLGYIGLGEVFVFIFFGPLATAGTYFLQTKTFSFPAILAGFVPGAFSCMLLVVNNLRDEKSDAKAKKNTLVVRFGKTFGSIEYAFFLALAAIVPSFLVDFFSYERNLSFYLLMGIFFGAIPNVVKIFQAKDPFEMIRFLRSTALIFIVYTFAFCLFT